METIDFNEVIRDPETISVVGELLSEATTEKKGLMPSYRADKSTSVLLDQNACILLFQTRSHKCFVDVYCYHAYRNLVRASLMVSSESTICNGTVAFINGGSATTEFYYAKLTGDSWGIYMKNLQGSLNVCCIPGSGATLLMQTAELPENAVKI